MALDAKSQRNPPGKRIRCLHDWFLEEDAVVGIPEMLHIETVRADEIPRDSVPQVERARGAKPLWSYFVKKRRRKPGPRFVEKENLPAALDRREMDLPGKRRRIACGGGNMDATSIGAVFPAVKRTHEPPVSSAPVRKVGAHVSAA